MVDQDGFVTEGSSSTAFILTGANVLVTRLNSSAVLPGCTRKAVQLLAEREGLTVEERSFSVAEAYEAKEAFLTSASNLVLPVVSLDGRPIGSGAPGDTSRLLRRRYIEWATNASRSSTSAAFPAHRSQSCALPRSRSAMTRLNTAAARHHTEYQAGRFAASAKTNVKNTATPKILIALRSLKMSGDDGQHEIEKVRRQRRALEQRSHKRANADSTDRSMPSAPASLAIR